MKNTLLTKFGFILSLFFASSTFAQTCIPDAGYTGSDNRPTTIGSNPAAPDGQSFLCGQTGLLSKVSFDLSASNSGCSQDSISFVISVLNGDTIDSPLLLAETFKVPSDFGRTMDTFTFVNPASVNSGSMYTLTIVKTAGQTCDSLEPNLTWYFEFPTNYWAATGGVQYQGGNIASLGNTQYFGTCIGSTAGLSSIETSFALALSPNPVINQLTITVNDNELIHVAVVNTLGETVMNTAASGLQTELDLTDLTTGIYYVQVETTQGTAIQKIVKN